MLESTRLIEAYPSAVGHLLALRSSVERGLREVAIVGPDAHQLHEAFWNRYRPHSALAYAPDGASNGMPLLEGRTSGHAYVCEGFVCQLPVTAAADFERLLDGR